jgi:hypothetical protein
MGGTQHDGYLELAKNLANGNGYVFKPGGDIVIHRPPAYVFCLVPGMHLPSFLHRFYVILLNSLLASGAVLVLKNFTMRLSDNKKLSIIAVIFLVVNPWIIWAIKNPMSIILQMFLYLLMIHMAIAIFYFKVKENRSNIIFMAIFLGVICGFSSLGHGIMLPLSVMLFFILLILAIKFKESIKFLALIFGFLAMAFIVLPWSIRNYVVAKQYIPVVGNSGVNYFGGNAYWGITKPSIQKEETIFKAILRHADVPLDYEDVFHYWGIKDIDVENQINAKMVHHIKSHPLSFGKKIFLNAIGYYFPIANHLIVHPKPFGAEQLAGDDSFKINNVEEWLISIYHAVFLILAICAIMNSKKSSLEMSGILVLVLASCIYAFPYFPFLTFVGHSQYAFGTLPFLYILSSDFCLTTYENVLGSGNERY